MLQHSALDQIVLVCSLQNEKGVYEQLLNSVSYVILAPIRTDVRHRSENACRS
jgi:hypothetical protein